MTPISDTDLDNILLEFINYSTVNYINNQYYQFLYNTGLRPVEPLRSSCVISRNEVNTLIQPAKHNDTRIISTNLIPASIWRKDYDNTSVIKEYQQENLANFMRKFPQTSNLTTSKKKALLYLFRYNYVKKLHAEGYSFEDVQEHMGWKTVEMAIAYIGKSIYNNK